MTARSGLGKTDPPRPLPIFSALQTAPAWCLRRKGKLKKASTQQNKMPTNMLANIFVS